MKLSVVDGLPVVPGSVLVLDTGSGFYFAYSKRVKGINTAYYLPWYAFVWEASKDIFAVFAEDGDFKTIDPGNTGEVMKSWELVPGNLAAWPVSPGWRADESVSPTAQPTVPATCGGVDLDANLKDATAVTP
jgi:hypothetical protein